MDTNLPTDWAFWTATFTKYLLSFSNFSTVFTNYGKKIQIAFNSIVVIWYVALSIIYVCIVVVFFHSIYILYHNFRWNSCNTLTRVFLVIFSSIPQRQSSLLFSHLFENNRFNGLGSEWRWLSFLPSKWGEGNERRCSNSIESSAILHLGLPGETQRWVPQPCLHSAATQSASVSNRNTWPSPLARCLLLPAILFLYK